jgi:hypothetical protein
MRKGGFRRPIVARKCSFFLLEEKVAEAEKLAAAPNHTRQKRFDNSGRSGSTTNAKPAATNAPYK